MLCVSLSERTLDGCLRVLDALQDGEMAEVRLDLIAAAGAGSVDEAGLEKICAHPRPKMLTCRDLRAPGFTEERRQLLERLLATGGAAMVDIEIEAPEPYREAVASAARAAGAEVIVSYHNYGGTPSAEELAKVVDACFAAGADIAKVAVQAHTREDAGRVLGLYADARRVVALAMGEHGKVTRAAALQLGAPFSFAALDKESATAPGQLTLEQMRAVAAAMR